MNKLIQLNSVEEIGKLYNINTTHPKISVFNLSEVKPMENHHCVLGIYSVVCRINDDGSGVVYFFSPSNTIPIDIKDNSNKRGVILNFHPSLLEDTLLMHRMPEYSFFHYAPHDILHLSSYDAQIVAGCIRGIGAELLKPMDRYTTRILVSGLAVLFSYCMRFYEREYSVRNDNSDIVKRLNMLLNNHLARPIHERCELPTVSWCAERMHLSPNYFGDLVKRQAGRSAQEIIHHRIIAEARMMIDRGKYSISEISFHLGFKYPHHLTRVFKRVLGITPNEYRMSLHRK